MHSDKCNPRFQAYKEKTTLLPLWRLVEIHHHWSSWLFLHYWSWLISDFSFCFRHFLLLHLASYIYLPDVQGPAGEELPNKALNIVSASKFMKYTGLEWSPSPFQCCPPIVFHFWSVGRNYSHGSPFFLKIFFAHLIWHISSNWLLYKCVNLL